MSRHPNLFTATPFFASVSLHVSRHIILNYSYLSDNKYDIPEYYSIEGVLLLFFFISVHIYLWPQSVFISEEIFSGIIFNETTVFVLFFFQIVLSPFEIHSFLSWSVHNPSIKLSYRSICFFSRRSVTTACLHLNIK